MGTGITDHDEEESRGAGWLGVGMAIGVALGSALGLALGSVGTGIAIGSGTGVAFGAAMMSARTRDEDDSDQLVNEHGRGQ